MNEENGGNGTAEIKEALPPPPSALRPKGMRMIRDLSQVAWKDGFVLVGALIPIRCNEKQNTIEIDTTRDGGQFTNCGDSTQIKFWLNFAANEAAMNEISAKLADSAIDKANEGKTDA